MLPRNFLPADQITEMLSYFIIESKRIVILETRYRFNQQSWIRVANIDNTHKLRAF